MPWSDKVRTHCTKGKRPCEPDEFAKGTSSGYCKECEADRMAERRWQLKQNAAKWAAHLESERKRQRQYHPPKGAQVA